LPARGVPTQEGGATIQMNEELLYRLVGEKVRAARERLSPKRSQAKLAQALGLSRTSLVNIECGRQRAPLHVLWRIAEALGIELADLLPRQAEYSEGGEPVRLDERTVEQIERAANGDLATRRLLTQF